MHEWGQTRESWRDEKSIAFQSRYLDDLVAGSNAAANVQEKIEALIRRVKKDCEQ